jgi:hypothetical protein
MENRKYELVKDDFIIHEGRKLYKIRALKNINTFKTFLLKAHTHTPLDNLNQVLCLPFQKDPNMYWNAIRQ